MGGSDTFRQTTPRAHGAATMEGAYQIDGMDIGYAGSEGGLIMYLDAHMYEEVNLQTGGASAESSKGGVITNMITRTGTNTHSGRYKFVGAGEGMHASNLSPELRADLLTAVPADTLAANPDIQPGAEIVGNYDHSVTLSGPFISDKLWYSGTASLVLQKQYLLSSYNPDGSKVLEDNRMRNGQYKISWQARPGSQLHFMHNFNSKERAGWGGGGVDFFESNWLRKQRINTNLYQGKWTSVLPGQILFDVSASFQDSLEINVPQPGLSLDTLSTFDSITRVHGGASPRYYDRPSWRHNILTSLSFVRGTHDVKVGYQFMYRHHGDTFFAIGPYRPAGLRAIFRDGVPNSVNTYNAPMHFDLYSRDHAVYIQDRWEPTRKLTLNVGARLETTYGRYPSMCQETNIFLDGQCFDAAGGIQTGSVCLHGSA